MTHHRQDNLSPEVMFSMNALRRAWHSVRRNGATPGADNIRLSDFSQNLETELKTLQQEVIKGKYRPQPIRRYYKTKSSGKSRPLSIWAVRDRVAQRVVHEYLTPSLEKIFLDCSYGFRPGRSIDDAIREIMVARKANLRWVLDADITECFDSIPVDLLMPQVRSVICSELAQTLIEQWLKTPVKGHFGERAGVSQGSVISPQLANLYLHRFDEMIAAALPETRLIRFADDFLILCRRKKEALWSMEVAARCLGSLRLELNLDKTKVIHFEEGFTFLGTNFKGRKYTLPGNNAGS